MSNTRTNTFAPNAVTVAISQDSTGISHVISGYGAETLVMIERDSETFEMYTGADNVSTRIYKANKAAKITLHLTQTSSSNDILSQLYTNDAASRDSTGMFSIMVKDNSGRSHYFAQEAFISVVPHSQFSNNMQLREWVIHCADMAQIIGGNSKFSVDDASTYQTLGGTIAPQWTP